jgi:Lrp/AsnC family leucine-responsive transcriptional regulator
MGKSSKSSARVSSRRSRNDATRPVKLDDTDLLILSMLQEDARVSNADIARRAKMVPSGILVRLRNLKKNKVILSHETRIDPQVLGLGLTAFVFVKAKEAAGHHNTADRLGQIPQVQEVHNITGEDCYLLKVRVADPQQLGRILRDDVSAIPSVISTRTTIVLDTFKETTALPIPKI